ncbi:queuosine precursor transporter [Candidatus Woesearchaeota archaeon]|nr:queuosine precursor transporter [Candidatus Woesearchaeota archaeon]
MIGCFLLVILAYTLWGKKGLYVWTAIAVIVANIQVMKTIEFFGLVTSMGNVVYGSIFLVTDILNEKYSKEDAKRAVWIGFYALIATTLIMQITLYFIPHGSDFISPHIDAIFSLLPRIAVASLTAYLVSQFHDVWFFAKLKKRFRGRFLWVRNNTSTILSQLLDNVIFTLIAFAGVFSWSVIGQIFITTLMMKIIISAADTPFVYWAKRIQRDQS